MEESTVLARLPLELLGKILGFYVTTHTLKAASLVCKTWTPFAQEHLFSSVVVTHQNVHAFAQALASNPEIRHLTCSLCLDDSPGHSGTSSSLGGHVSFVRSLENSRRLRTLELRFISVMSLSAMLPDLVLSFLPITTLECEKVQFSSFPQLIQFICSFKSIQNLRLINIDVADSIGNFLQTTANARLSPSLRTCSAFIPNYTTPFLHWLQNHDPAPLIGLFRIALVPPRSDPIPQETLSLWLGVRSLIVNLDILCLSLDATQSLGEFDLAGCMNLRRLAIHSVDYLELPARCNLSRLAELLGTVCSDAMEEVRIDLVSLRVVDFGLLDWEGIDLALSTRCFSHLKRVFIGVQAVLSLEDFRGHINTWLPICRQRGLLHVERIPSPLFTSYKWLTIQ
ncbi:hypothetical protein HGRIS_012473 [Hohenbuehelia grisea]|uniref:F-box domain-containing protein n=1 Tax=Hohenbuehelia grisea TaxID=104357 RepID=A0ABR3ISH4_9AGAR